jgi:TonB family protein
MFGLYWFLLRQEKLFVFNRFFLLFAILFSLIIPFISIPVNLWNNEVPRNITSVLNTNIPEIITEQNPTTFNLYPSSSQVLRSQIDISMIFMFLYFSGVFLFLFRFLRNIYYISRQIEISEKINYLGKRIALINHQINPYCFFNTIFVNKQDYLNNKIEKELLSHELEHIKQSHSIDVILVELIQILYWFNPILYLYNRAVRINHEYMADNDVVQSSLDIQSYSDKLINFISCNKNVPLTAGFNQSLTRKRLLMLTKSKPNKINVGIRIFLIVNLIAVFFLLMSFKNSTAQSVTSMTSNNVPENIQKIENKPLVQVEQMPEFQGGGQDEMRIWIRNNMNYPSEAFNQKIEDRVCVRFTVNSKGKVQDITIINPTNPLLDNEVKRVISIMPDWKPGKQGGKPVDVYIMTCVYFKF